MTRADNAHYIHDILDSGGVCAHFQPILSARQKSIIGIESLARGIAGVEAMASTAALVDGRLISPDILFQMARQEGVVERLEELCQETAVSSFADLNNRPEGLVLFMNFDPSIVKDDYAAADRLYGLVRSAGIPPRNVAIEILESKIDDLSRLCSLFDRFRQWGFLVVLDDVGAGHSNLNRIPLIKPDILKVDRGLVSNIDADYYKQETFKSLVGLSRRIGALMVSEGVETESEAIVSLELGADLLQGFFLSKAQELSNFNDAVLTNATSQAAALARTFKSYMVGKINQRKLQHRRFNVILNQLLCELTNSDADQFDRLLILTIAHYPTVECIFILDEGGIQVSDTVCNASIPRKDSGVMFQPAPKGTDHSLKEYYYFLMDVELQKYTTDPYVSLASGNLCRTISTVFRDAANNKMYVLCIDVSGEDISRECE